MEGDRRVPPNTDAHEEEEAHYDEMMPQSAPQAAYGYAFDPAWLPQGHVVGAEPYHYAYGR